LREKAENAAAFDTLQLALQIDSTASAAWYEIAKHYLIQGKDTEALTAMQKAVRYNSGIDEYQTLLGEWYAQKKRYPEAIELYERLAAKYPDKPENFMYLSELYVRSQQFEKAIQSLNQLENNLGVVETISKQKYLLYQMTGQDKKAIQEIEKLIEKDPEVGDDINLWRDMMSTALRNNFLDQAIRISRQAIEYFPDAPEFYFYQGTALSEQKNYTEALKSFTAGLQKAPSANKALLANFYGQLGDIYYQMGEKTKAYEYYDQALETKEASPMILNNYAYFLALDKKDLDKAERISAKCVQAQPDNVTFIDTYAWVFFQKGNYSLAKFYIESALEKTADIGGDITEHYGDILFMSGQTGEAVREWEKALQLKEKQGDNIKLLKKKISKQKYVEK
jgi:tetratricopeptide (TPR) repeat protein